MEFNLIVRETEDKTASLDITDFTDNITHVENTFTIFVKSQSFKTTSASWGVSIVVVPVVQFAVGDVFSFEGKIYKVIKVKQSLDEHDLENKLINE